MTAVFPSSLLTMIMRDGFNEQSQPNVALFKPDVGPAKARRRSSAKVVNTSISFVFDDDQLADFNEFFDTTIADGTLPFEMDHPRTGVTYLWRFADQMPQTQPYDLNWQVTCQLQRLP